MTDRTPWSKPRRCVRMGRGASVVLGLGLLPGVLPACSSPIPSEVVVLGMVHDGHIESDVYGPEQIKAIVRRIDPDYVLCEIPPERLPIAMREYRETGVISEPRVKVFPEYVDAIIPLSEEMGFTIVGCSAWTKEMADDRKEKLEHWEDSRPAETAIVERARDRGTRAIAIEGRRDDPAWVNSDRYGHLVRYVMDPYNRLFNADLGLGGWDNINAAHYELIMRAINAHTGEGKRFLITFGAWHRYWFVAKLEEREAESEDVLLLPVEQFLR